MPSFIFETGCVTSGCATVTALRIRVSMSATGSVIHHQDAFLTPGSSPFWASSRKQIRDIPKSRR